MLQKAQERCLQTAPSVDWHHCIYWHLCRNFSECGHVFSPECGHVLSAWPPVHHMHLFTALSSFITAQADCMLHCNQDCLAEIPYHSTFQVIFAVVQELRLSIYTAHYCVMPKHEHVIGMAGREGEGEAGQASQGRSQLASQNGHQGCTALPQHC